MNPMLYLLLALTTVLAVTASPGEPVLDINGDIIFDGSYYVIPRIFGPGGGGLTLAPRRGICPLYIGQEDSEVKMGIPVRFSDWRIKVAFVPESTNLNIKMDVLVNICSQPSYWNVAGPNIEMREVYLPAGPKPSNGLFQIEKLKDAIGGYKIVFCPNDSSYCHDIGIFVDKLGVRRLVLSKTPFEVVFVRATVTKTSSKPIMSII
ncbi:unnamed protein product [Eruca vesicaria subsp. sativa]|uniref:Uncharacterized protein n=1 Tax=Eruca vesicaria subsp. sativa TaxID=29727 RepID=A0ABC8JWL1_ERUVS|nr:unnamed protein product [Eruca vesicaria subsp. sativa]